MLLVAGNQPMGPWCYVDAKTCKYPPLNDTTGQSYGWCTNEASTTTYDTGAPALPGPYLLRAFLNALSSSLTHQMA